MKRFAKLYLGLTLPIYIVLGAYFLLDPFEVLYPHHHSYFLNHLGIINRELVSLNKWKKYSPSNNYDSFIFGSSRVCGFRAKDWKNYLPQGSTPFFFDASGENINGIWQKITYLHRQHSRMKNAVILVSADCTFGEDRNDDIRYVHHHELSGMSIFKYHLLFITAFFNKGFFLPYIDYTIFKTWRNYFKDYFAMKEIIYSPIYNELILASNVKELNACEDCYYAKLRLGNFFHRDESGVMFNISSEQFKKMMEVRKIFNEDSTDYKVVITPLFDRVPLGERNKLLVERVFGKDKVYDFSTNDSITNNYRNYYENQHFRVKVGRYIFKKIYQ